MNGQILYADQVYDEVLDQGFEKKLDFVVLERDGSVCGVLFHEMFTAEFAQKFRGRALRDIVSKHFEPVPAEQTLDKVYRIFGEGSYRIVPVTRDQVTIGIIDRRIIEEVMRRSD